MQNGAHPLFRGDQVPIYPVLCNPDFSSRQVLKAVPWMPIIMLDLLSFSRLLSEVERTQRPKLDPLDYTETLLSFLYRLVEVLPLGQGDNKHSGLYGDVIYFAMLAFMTTLLPEYTRDGSRCPFLSDCVGSAIQDLYISAAAESDPSLFLWILFISGISVLNLKDHHWLSPLIAHTCERLELDSWTAIQQQLSQFPWIFTFHEAPGCRLWGNVRLSREIS